MKRPHGFRLPLTILRTSAFFAALAVSLVLATSVVVARSSESVLAYESARAVHAVPTTPLERRLGAALASAGLPAGRNGAVVLDLTSGEVVFKQSGGVALVPASNEKLPITFAALSVLGAEFQIETEAIGEGIREGTGSANRELD